MPDKDIISIDKFKDKAKNDNTENVAVRKQFNVEVKEVDDENRTIEVVSSTPARDRDMDTINPEGWMLDDYKKNPIVLWAHDYSKPPIGKAVDNWIQDGQLRQRIQFVPKEISPFADMIYQMYKEGYMNAVSVGFDPKEWQWSDDEEGNIDFQQQSLLETSAVPVPSNPEALMVAGKEGDKELIKTYAEEMKKWSKEVLKEGEDMDYQLEIEPVFDTSKKDKEGNVIGEAKCPHCQGELYMRKAENSIGEMTLNINVKNLEDIDELKEKIKEIKEVNSEQSDDIDVEKLVSELKTNQDNEKGDEIDIDAEQLSKLVSDKVKEQVKQKTGKIL